MIFAVGFPLRSVLAKLSEEERRQLAQRVGLPSAPRTDAKRLVAALTDPAYLQRQLDDLPAVARQLLVALLISGGQALVETVHRLKGVTPAIHALARSGLLYLVRPDYLGMMYVLPLEFLDPLWHRLVDWHGWPFLSRRTAAREVVPAELWTPFWHDLLLLLTEARREPLPLTKELRLYKRAESRLLAKTWPRPDRARQYAGLALAQSFAHENGLVAADPYHRVLQTTSRAEGFLNQPPDALWSAWWDFACRLSMGFDPVSQVSLAVAATLAPDQWVDLPAYCRWMEQMCLSYFQAEHLHLMLEQWAALDLVELADDAYRLSDLGYAASRRRFAQPQPGRHIVQPTGEVLVPPEAPLAERWWLAELAEVRQSDRMEVYALTPAAVERALDGGIDLAAALTRLTQFSRTAIPQNVEENLRDWYRGLLRHRLLSVTVVHSETTDLSRQVEQALGGLVLFRLSDQDVVIAPDQVEAVTTQLQRAGIMVRARVETPGQVAAGLATPTPPAHRRQGPLVSNASLPPDDPRLEMAAQNALRERLNEAIRNRRPLLVQFVPTGGSRPIVQSIRPTLMANGWLHGHRVDDHAMVAIPLPYILAAAEPKREPAHP